MSPDKPNVNNAKFVFDFYDQPAFVARDVKAYSVVSQDTGMTIIRFYIGRRFPLSQFGCFVPSLEWLFGIGMLFPEGCGSFETTRSYFLTLDSKNLKKQALRIAG
jgi:hypothetical protein